MARPVRTSGHPGRIGSMQVTVELAPIEEKSVIRNMLQLYLHDFSEFAGFELDGHGYYGYGRLDVYWMEEERFPFIVRVDGQLAGFVFIRTEDLAGNPRYSVAEFFILRKYRRHGIGTSVMRQVVGRFPDQWSLAVDLRNEAGLPFWRKVVGELTDGHYTEHPGDSAHRIVLEFTVKGSA
jgi:predicted acetyltransferase